MSVEAFAHQLYEPLVIPDDMEARLRDILTNQLHVKGVDLEIALQNPADVMARLSALLLDRYNKPTEYLLQHGEHTKTFTIGSNFEDALRVQQLMSSHNTPNGVELSMATDGMNTMYQEGTIAHISVNDDMSWVKVIGFSGRHHGFPQYTETTVTEPHLVNEIYMHALDRLIRAVDTVETLPALSDYVIRELGKSALLSKTAA